MAVTVHCPTCGGPNELRSRAIRLAACQFCDQTLLIDDGGVSEGGKTQKLMDLITDLSVGAVVLADGENLVVHGRARYAYDAGYWDEWWVERDDGRTARLHEDEGELALVEAVDTGTISGTEGVRAGERVTVDGQSVYVTETRTAKLYGVEGQLPRELRVGMELRYIDGTVGQHHIMLELIDGRIDRFEGEGIDDVEVRVR